jgi:hypothetical protein
MEIIQEIKKDVSPTDEDMKVFENELHDINFKNPNIFRGLSGIFIYPDTKITFLKIAEECFKFRGGKVVKEDKTATIFVDKNYYKGSDQAVNYQWILDSSEACQKLDLEGYKI